MFVLLLRVEDQLTKTNKMEAYYIKTPEARLLSNVVKHAVERLVITLYCLLIASLPLIYLICKE